MQKISAARSVMIASRQTNADVRIQIARTRIRKMPARKQDAVMVKTAARIAMTVSQRILVDVQIRIVRIRTSRTIV